MADNSQKVSFCITCKGRLHHLRQTLSRNIEDNLDHDETEFVLLDYTSPDGLGDWVKAEHLANLKTGKVVYYRTNEFERFSMPHAKNVAHRLATGSIVCNLDCDNFTGKGFAAYLCEKLARSTNVFLHGGNLKNISGKIPLWTVFRLRFIRGVGGRIALRKADFEKLRGYDERMNLGWGYEDDDFIRRAQLAGLHPRLIRPSGQFLGRLLHSDVDRFRHYPVKNKKESREAHKIMSDQTIASGQFAVNCQRSWGSATVIKNFTREILLD